MIFNITFQSFVQNTLVLLKVNESKNYESKNFEKIFAFRCEISPDIFCRKIELGLIIKKRMKSVFYDVKVNIENVIKIKCNTRIYF